MMLNHDEPVDLGERRAKREELERERRRMTARDDLTAYAPDYGRVIPPPLNADIPGMVKDVKDCYDALSQWIVNFQDKIGELVDAGDLKPAERQSLSEHYRDLQTAVEAAIVDAPKGDPGSRANEYWHDGIWNSRAINRFADHAKYVYAVGARDIAALQYRLAELAGTGRLDPAAHHGLQWNHCLPMWETLYSGTTCAVRDERTWDGAWDWYDNTYSDGRQVMAQARLKNWPELDRRWPYNEGMAGDGPIQEHPWGSVCQIHPVTAPEKDGYWHPCIEIDLEDLIKRLGPRPNDEIRTNNA